jgi:N-dimethylarginine dimethylaminohydrolase
MCCGRKPKKTRSRGISRFKRGPIKLNTLGTEIKMDFLMCRPEFYGIHYQINPWMNIHNGSDKDKAVSQWNALESKIKELGSNVLLAKSKENLPDMVFTANAGLVLKNGSVIISKFTHPERAGEEELFAEWFNDNGRQTVRAERSFEGAGDALYLGETLVGGHGFRSDPDVYRGLTSTVVRLVDPYFYHLDTCFCPLDGMDYMIWPGAFDGASLETIANLKGTAIVVPETDAKQFACNAVRIGRNVILPSGCDETVKMLEQHGYIPHPLDMSEFIKAGGACKCLTLVI